MNSVFVRNLFGKVPLMIVKLFGMGHQQTLRPQMYNVDLSYFQKEWKSPCEEVKSMFKWLGKVLIGDCHNHNLYGLYLL